MQGKIQKHQAFEAELEANETRISAVSAKGLEMLESGHEHSDDINAKLDELNELSNLLQQNSKEKGKEFVSLINLLDLAVVCNNISYQPINRLLYMHKYNYLNYF